MIKKIFIIILIIIYLHPRATAEKYCSREGYWACYTYGMMRGIVDQLDLLSLFDVAQELLENQYKTKLSCLADADGFTLKFQGEDQRDEAIHLILKCGLGIDITLQEIKTRYDTLQSYINRNWESPYLRGQATIFLATIILPTVANIGTTAKAALLSKLENTSVLSKELNTIKALEATKGDLDEIAKVIGKSKNWVKFLDDPIEASKFADEIISINKKTEGGGILLSGSPSSAINTASYYTKVHEQAASIFKTIIKNHMFADGNKRTAVEMFKSYSAKSGIQLNLTDKELMDIALKVENNTFVEIVDIANALTK